MQIQIRRGNEQPTAKLNDQKVLEIRAAARLGEKHYLIAKRFGVSAELINRVVRGDAWTHVKG